MCTINGMTFRVSHYTLLGIWNVNKTNPTLILRFHGNNGYKKSQK